MGEDRLLTNYLVFLLNSFFLGLNTYFLIGNIRDGYTVSAWINGVAMTFGFIGVALSTYNILNDDDV
jgi:hypothetical protein